MSSDTQPPYAEDDSADELREDRVIRERLRRGVPEPSQAHDDAILAAARDAFDAPAPARAANRQRVLLPAALAATLMLGVVGLLLIPASDPGQTPDLTLRGGTLTHPASGSVLDTPPDALQWTIGIGGTGLPAQRRVVLRG